jgi:hypothetical protein
VLEAKHRGAYTKIYPLHDKDSYDEYLKAAKRLFYKDTLGRFYTGDKKYIEKNASLKVLNNARLNRTLESSIMLKS